MMSLQTLAVHAGEGPRVDGAAVFPVFQSATFLFTGQDSYHTVRYTRCNNNPSQLAVAAKVASLEGAASAAVAASGMACISTTLLALLSSGDHMLIQGDLYGGTHSLVTEDLPACGIEHTMVDGSASLEDWEAQLRPNTKVIYVETISNPLLRVPNIPVVVAFAKKHGLVSIIDNTFASPVCFRPLDHGIDLVIESCTKYMNGHSDVIAGSVAGSSELVGKVMRKLNHLGGCMDPHACFLLQRGLKTISLRVRQQGASALALARMLHEHPQVAVVHYPGLDSHPNHRLAQLLFDPKGGYGGMLALELKGGVEAAEAFMHALTLALVAVSLGGVETLITRPALTTHIGQLPEQREAMGISDALIRVSVGIEDTDDLLADFTRALEVAGLGP